MEDFLDKFYANTSDDTRGRYAQWSKTYDQEVNENGYVTPARAAKALASHVKDLITLVLDYGCGTGLSGMAFRALGFNTVDGIDVSKKMVAIGVIGIGAVPVSVFDTIITLLVTGVLFTFSFNDHALADPTFKTKVSDYVDTGKAKLILREYGGHMHRAGLKSNTYILEML